MPSKIQRVPSGLLAALGAVGTGQNPDQLSDAVLMQLDASFWYLPRLEVDQAQTTGITVNTGNALSVVPAGQFWFVRRMGGEILASAAGGFMRGSLAIRITDGEPFIDIAGSGPVVQAASASDSVQWGTEVNLLLPPGATVRVNVDQDVVTGTVTARCKTMFHRIQAA